MAMVSPGSHHEEELGGALALRHRTLQQHERRRRRESVRMQLLLLLPVAAVREDDVKRRRGDDCQARELELLQQITERRGFITQQLHPQATLRPLERWHHQLQLMKIETTTASAEVRDDRPVNEDDAEEEDHAIALLKLERVLAQDVACFDLQYACDSRVQDMVTSLFDSAQSQSPLADEILSFSTMKSGRVCRVTCVRTSTSAPNEAQQPQQYGFHSSLFVHDFAAKASRLLLEPSDAHSLIDLVWSDSSP